MVFTNNNNKKIIKLKLNKNLIECMVHQTNINQGIRYKNILKMNI